MTDECKACGHRVHLGEHGCDECDCTVTAPDDRQVIAILLDEALLRIQEAQRRLGLRGVDA